MPAPGRKRQAKKISTRRSSNVPDAEKVDFATRGDPRGHNITSRTFCNRRQGTSANMADTNSPMTKEETHDFMGSTDPIDLARIQEQAEQKKEEANQFYVAKEYKQALVGYNEAINLCPETARYYSNRAACYMMLLQYKDALKDAKKCIELDPKFTKAYGRLIKCSIILGDIVQAGAAIRKLEEFEPLKQSIIPEINELSKLQELIKVSDDAYSKKDYRKVVYFMDRCLEISTFGQKFKILKAECLAYLSRYNEAEMTVNDVLHLDKQNADAIYIRGLCLYYQDNIDRAFKHFQQVLRLAPDHAKALDSYKRAKLLKTKKEEGNDAFKAERYQEAYNLYTQALQIDPLNNKANAKLHFNKATVAAKLNKVEESISECTEALNLDEDYLKPLLRRAACYMELQKFEEAVQDYEKACKLDKASRDNRRLLLEAKQALKKSKRKDYYKILGIEKTASTDDIKKAYRKRAMVHHPDRHSNADDGAKKEQEIKFKEVGEAYSILSDPKKRSRYDSGHDMEDGEYFDMDINRFQAFFENSPFGKSYKFEFV